MTRRPSRLVACLPLVASIAITMLASSSRAHAQRSPEAVGDPAVAESQVLFRRGVELGEQDRWTEALEHFRRSRELAVRPNTVFNIGFALHRLGRFGRAIEQLDEYLAMTATDPEATRRDEAIALRDQARASLAVIDLEISPPDARIFVDGEPVSTTAGTRRTIELDPGRHALRAAAPGHDDGTITISVLAGEHGRRRLSLAPDAAVVADAPAARRGLIEEPLFWVVAGVVVVGAGVGIGAGVAATGGAPGGSGGSTGVVIDALSF